MGLAKKLLQGENTYTGVGTPLQHAPEVLIKKCYDHKIDVWGIAHIFYNLMTRQHIFNAQGKTSSEAVTEYIKMIR